jgi:hypothetical protein
MRRFKNLKSYSHPAINDCIDEPRRFVLDFEFVAFFFSPTSAYYTPIYLLSRSQIVNGILLVFGFRKNNPYLDNEQNFCMISKSSTPP